MVNKQPEMVYRIGLIYTPYIMLNSSILERRDSLIVGWDFGPDKSFQA